MCLRAGTEADYIQWLAHSTESTGSSDGCVLGYKETFLRLRKDSVCFNGRNYAVIKKLSPCPCTLDDYHWYEFQHVGQSNGLIARRLWVPRRPFLFVEEHASCMCVSKLHYLV